MGFAEIVEKVKGMFEGNQEWKDAPPREIRDKHLEALEREDQYYIMQARKEFLKKKLLALKKKQVKDKIFGKYTENHSENILNAKLEDSGVDLNNGGNSILKQKNMFKQKRMF